MQKIDEYLSANSHRFEDELCELLRIPSVSADSRHKADVRQGGRVGAAAISVAGS